MLIIDSLAYASRLRRLHPGIKLVAAGVPLLLAAVWQNAVFGLALTGIMCVCSVWGGRTPLRIYLKLMKLPLVFIGLSLIAIVVNVSGEPVVTAESLARGGQLGCSALGAVSCMYFLALSTPVTDLLYVLEKLHCPHLVLELMLLIYRFVFLLWETAGHLGRAAEGRLGNVNFATSVCTAGQMFATLFIRAFQRSSAIYDAMESRGYDGTIRVLPGYAAGEKTEAGSKISESNQKVR